MSKLLNIGNRTYKVNNRHCLLCEHASVLWDYTHGVYMITCDIKYDLPYRTKQNKSGKCGHFKEVNENECNDCNE